jgi:hypothetical protein
MMSKLTLSVDRSVVTRAKRYAKRQGISVSEMVEAYLAIVSNPIEVKDTSAYPAIGSGDSKEGGVAEYRKHLTEKFR